MERTYGAKYPEVTKRSTDNGTNCRLLRLPAEHRIHLRTTNPVESTYATVRLQTKVADGAGSRAAGLAMASHRSSPHRPAGGP